VTVVDDHPPGRERKGGVHQGVPVAELQSSNGDVVVQLTAE
tara:strand:+ start:2419 stop:2541 length:123 start_codon:yes stop_codon:yes gene_type:complete